MFRIFKTTALTLSLLALSQAEAKWTFTDRVSPFNVDVVNGMDESGNVTALWTDWYSNPIGLYSSDLRQGEHESWKGTETVYKAKGKLFLSPHIAVDAFWNTVAIWEEFGDSQAQVKVSTRPFKGAWSEPVDLTPLTHKNKDTLPQIAISPTGYAVAVWSSNSAVESATFQFGGSWSRPICLSSNGSDPKVAVDKEDNAVVVWSSDEKIQSACLPWDGKWSAVVNVSSGKSHDPHLAMNPTGYAVATWVEGNGPVQKSALNAATMQFGEPWSAPVLLDQADRIGPSDVAVDIHGNAIVIWSKQDSIHNSDYPILSNRYLQSSSLMGGSWSSPVHLSSKDEMMMNPRVTFDGLGNAFAIWNTYSAVQAAIQPARQSWTEPKNLAKGTYGLITKPQICADARGYAVVNWTSQDGRIESSKWIPEKTAEPETESGTESATQPENESTME